MARARIARIWPRELVLSGVCIMEMALEQSTGKLSLGAGGSHQFVAELIADGVETPDIGIEHVLRMGLLPPRHRDPFDRPLVAQATVEGLTLVSADANVLAYDVRTLISI